MTPSYTRSELELLNKVILRKFARDINCDMMLAAKMDREALIDWIIVNQGPHTDEQEHEREREQAEHARQRQIAREWEEKFVKLKERLRRASTSFSLCKEGEKKEAYLWVRTKSVADLDNFSVFCDLLLERGDWLLQTEPVVVNDIRLERSQMQIYEELQKLEAANAETIANNLKMNRTTVRAILRMMWRSDLLWRRRDKRGHIYFSKSLPEPPR